MCFSRTKIGGNKRTRLYEIIVAVRQTATMRERNDFLLFTVTIVAGCALALTKKALVRVEHVGGVHLTVVDVNLIVAAVATGLTGRSASGAPATGEQCSRGDEGQGRGVDRPARAPATALAVAHVALVSSVYGSSHTERPPLLAMMTLLVLGAVLAAESVLSAPKVLYECANVSVAPSANVVETIEVSKPIEACQAVGDPVGTCAQVQQCRAAAKMRNAEAFSVEHGADVPEEDGAPAPAPGPPPGPPPAPPPVVRPRLPRSLRGWAGRRVGGARDTGPPLAGSQW